jgi:serine/threonine-protein kinase
MRACPKCGAEYPDEVQFCPEDGTRLGAGDSLTGSRAVGEPEPGSVLGAYRLSALVGAGAMSVIYAAEHVRLGRRVAIKLLRREFTADPAAVRRFFQEARAVNQIRHPHIVEVTDFVEEPGGDNYTVMELLEGESLAELLARHGPLPPWRAARIGAQIARALSAVHAAGIVHRDLKTENAVLVERGGDDFVKLLDFGVAKLLDGSAGRPLHQTGAGAIIGTPAYMSVEQAAGRPIDQRSDLYSLGVILYEMITGRRPFDAESYGELVIQHLAVEPPPPSRCAGPDAAVPPELEALIMRCLAKEPADRPAAADELAAALEALAGDGETGAGSGDPIGTGRSRRGPRLAAVGLLVVLLAAAGWWLWRQRVAQRAEPAAAEGAGGPARPAAPQRRAAPRPRPQQVRIELESVPAGARVFAAGSERLLGITPLRLPLPRSGQPRVLVFELPRYRRVRQQIVPDADRRLRVVLGRRRAARAGQRRRRAVDDRSGGRLQGGREGTIDPFGGS